MPGNDDLDGPDAVSDQELLDLLKAHPSAGLDGIWHPQTIGLAQKFSVDRFDLNRWWCTTFPHWICPGCNRGKPDIVRVNQHGELMCHLVEHHDHMDRYIEKCLGEYVGRLPAFFATIDSERFARRSSLAIAAFDETIICEDCNNLDTAAKKHVRAHLDFSFTPQDIRRFAIVRPNQPHEIDSAKLREVWTFREVQLQRRFELAHRIVELAATNEHWYEQADPLHHAERVERSAKAHLTLFMPRGWNINIGQYEAVSAPKSVRATNARGWRKNKRCRAAQPPNLQELKWTTGVTHLGGDYDKLPPDWSCPWCHRSKFQVVRPSKQFKWSFATRDPWVVDLRSGRRSKVIVCQDCGDVRIQIAKEANAQAQAVQPSDVISIIRPEPHAQHALKTDPEIDAVVKLLAERAAALGLSKTDLDD
jgi:hypothetical protein